MVRFDIAWTREYPQSTFGALDTKKCNHLQTGAFRGLLPKVELERPY